MSFHCTIHKGAVADDAQRILIDSIEQGSGPGIPVYACRLCVTQHRIVPFAAEPEHGCLDDAPRPTRVQRAP